MPDLTAPTRGREPPHQAVTGVMADARDRRIFRRLLVAFDGSSHAHRALDAAIELARANDGALTVITVAPDPSFSGPRGASLAAIDTEALAARIERGYQVTLAGAVEAVPADVPVSKILRHGAPGPAITAAAEQGHHDLIVMGSRGRGNPHAPVGSVCDHVLRAAPLSVLIVTPPDPGSAVAGQRSDHV
jgi:nucleotide-binding universal stress UspA family protein